MAAGGSRMAADSRMAAGGYARGSRMTAGGSGMATGGSGMAAGSFRSLQRPFWSL